MTPACYGTDTFEFAHPFIRERVSLFDGEGTSDVITWRPGTRNEPVYPDDSEMVADGIGSQIVTVVSRHRPGKWPERVFFTRRWRDPDGKEFGKKKLHVTTAGAFTTLVRGYRHRYSIARKEIQEKAS